MEEDEFIFTEDKRSKRLRLTKNIERKRAKLAESIGLKHSDQWHRYSKKHPMDCGQPGCGICGNPRKIFKEKTLQEKRFESREYD